ncbi:MAG: ribosome maturation factor RimM [Thermodesulfobacteriota bacterium]|nr:ribosome maturation factor RimM [Thermodesulfobacteriota bacterium]
MAKSLLEIGKIVGTHGLRGDLKVRLNSGDPDLLLTLKQIELSLPTGEPLSVNISRQVLHKGRVLLHLQGLDSIDQVELLVGSQVLIDEELLPELSDDEYYWGELKGLEVVDRERGSIGQLQDLLSSSAHDTYVVKGRFGEVLIPAVQQFILGIDLERQIMQVALPEGLIPDEQ